MRAWILLIALSPCASAQTTWYVDGSHTPPGSGTAGDPYVTIQSALDQAGSGDTVLVAPGVYVENLDFYGIGVILQASEDAHTTHLVPALLTESTIHGLTEQPGFPHERPIVRGLTVRDHTGTVPAVDVRGGEELLMEHCVLRDNAVAVRNRFLIHLWNCNLVDNEIAVIHDYSIGWKPITFFKNSILWSNTTNLHFPIGPIHPEDYPQDHCLVDVDPLFFGPDDHHLLPSSPCINAGEPGEADPDGSPLDIGALPYDPNYPLGTSYCTPTANSSGGRAVIALSGSASLSANNLVVAATRTPANSSGLFFLGTARTSFPLGDGLVCAGGQIGRLPLTPTGPNGTPIYAFDTAHVPGHVPPIQPGEGRALQYWFRDPVGGSAGWNYSNAVWVVFGP